MNKFENIKKRLKEYLDYLDEKEDLSNKEINELFCESNSVIRDTYEILKNYYPITDM